MPRAIARRAGVGSDAGNSPFETAATVQVDSKFFKEFPGEMLPAGGYKQLTGTFPHFVVHFETIRLSGSADGQTAEIPSLSADTLFPAREGRNGIGSVASAKNGSLFGSQFLPNSGFDFPNLPVFAKPPVCEPNMEVVQ